MEVGQGMKTIECSIPESIYRSLITQMNSDKESLDHLVAAALALYLGESFHTLFQVSTSAALVEGLYQGAVRVEQIEAHGDFGLGTFVDLDGEMVVLDGSVYRLASDGSVTEVEDSQLIPYAVVTRFRVETHKNDVSFSAFDELVAVCDGLRSSENLFYAFRVDGAFSSLHCRIVRAVAKGTPLTAAASGESLFTVSDVKGTLVGIWSPTFAGSFSVPGYHFHFIADDRKMGGHVLDCEAEHTTIRACSMTEMHVALPETEEFLQADLTRDPTKDLESAERSHSS
jgi:acetolactate decarboxylase